MMKKKNTKAMYDMVKKMNRGGGPIIGRIKPKDMEKVTPIGVKKIMTGEMMEAASDKARNLKDPSLRKTVAEVEKPGRKKRRRKNKKAEETDAGSEMARSKFFWESCRDMRSIPGREWRSLRFNITRSLNQGG